MMSAGSSHRNRPFARTQFRRNLTLKTLPACAGDFTSWCFRLTKNQLRKQNQTTDKLFKSNEVDSRARVLEKPEPQYTEAARNNQVTGTVVLRAVFSSNGSVTSISVIRGLPYGLNERAITAARQIRLIPATEDDRPVSMWMQLEYNFNLY